MESEILCELFLQNKAKAHTNQKKCVGFLSENGEFRYRIVLQEKPANAVLYLCVRQSRNTEKLLEYEKQRLFRYCDTQGYQPIVLLESIGGEPFLGKHAQGRIMELAELRYVDVVVLSHVNSLFQFLDHTSGSQSGLCWLRRPRVRRVGVISEKKLVPGKGFPGQADGACH